MDGSECANWRVGSTIRAAERMEPQPQFGVAGFTAKLFLAFDVVSGLEHLDVTDHLAKLHEQGADNEAGVGCAEAQVLAETEGNVRVRLAVEADFPR
jgi:hypothetical protein